MRSRRDPASGKSKGRAAPTAAAHRLVSATPYTSQLPVVLSRSCARGRQRPGRDAARIGLGCVGTPPAHAECRSARFTRLPDAWPCRLRAGVRQRLRESPGCASRRCSAEGFAPPRPRRRNDAPSGRRTATSPSCTPRRWQRARARSGARPARAASPARGQPRRTERRPLRAAETRQRAVSVSAQDAARW